LFFLTCGYSASGSLRRLAAAKHPGASHLALCAATVAGTAGAADGMRCRCRRPHGPPEPAAPARSHPAADGNAGHALGSLSEWHGPHRAIRLVLPVGCAFPGSELEECDQLGIRRQCGHRRPCGYGPGPWARRRRTAGPRPGPASCGARPLPAAG